MKKAFLSIIVSFCALAVVIIYQLIVFTDNQLHIVMCDIGQGDAIYVRSPSGLDMLIDSGPDKSVVSCLNRHMPLWDRHIDIAVLTNADLDHYGGFKYVLEQYTVGQFISPNIGKNDEGFEILEKTIQETRTPVKIISSGDIVRDKKIQLTALWPIKEDTTAATLPTQTGRVVLGAKTVSGSVNEYSLVLKLSYLDFDMLFTGDIMPPATDEMAKRVGIVEVLKVPHHGSKNGLTRGLLTAAQPKISLVSSGKNNRFGHPAKETLALLQEFQIKTYRTDHLGDIEVVSDGKNWSVR